MEQLRNKKVYDTQKVHVQKNKVLAFIGDYNPEKKNAKMSILQVVKDNGEIVEDVEIVNENKNMNQILTLLQNIKEKSKSTIMLYTNDLSVVNNAAEYVNVMYAGKIVESALVKELFENPKHPYTVELIKGTSSLNEENRLSSNVLEGCSYAPHCAFASEKCFKYAPPSYKVKSSHHVSCFFYEDELVESDKA